MTMKSVGAAVHTCLRRDGGREFLGWSGPRLFIVYTADLEDHVAQHGVSFHAFADDTQLYDHCRRDEVTSAVPRLENCIEEVSDWMSANRLKLNADKTELLWAGSRHGPATLGSGLELRRSWRVIRSVSLA